MGKTYKKHVPLLRLRHMRGYRQARRCIGRGYSKPVRPKAVPPNSCNDIPVCKLTVIPYRAASRMLIQGYNLEEATRRISRKFRLPYLTAEKICVIIWEDYQFKCRLRRFTK